MMRTQTTIYMTHDDVERLRKLIKQLTFDPARPNESAKALEEEMARSVVLPAAEIPPEVVTMYATASAVDLDTGETFTYTLVFPEDAAIDEGKISILAPIGTALLGYKVGDTIEWPVPDGTRRIHLRHVQARPQELAHAAR